MSFRRNAAGKITRTQLDGYTFASKLEAALYAEIKRQALGGQVVLEQVQDHIYLTDARVLYVPDFRVLITATGETEWWEAKGFESERWPMIKKLWAYYGPGKLRIWKGTHMSLRLVETITPKAVKLVGWALVALSLTACTPTRANPVRLNLIAEPAPAYDWPGARCPEPTPCECHCETPTVTEGETQ